MRQVRASVRPHGGFWTFENRRRFCLLLAGAALLAAALPGCKRLTRKASPEEMKVRDAIAALKEQIAEDEANPDLYLQRGKQYFELAELCGREYRQDVYDAAVKDFETCHAKTPGGSGPALVEIAHVYMRLYRLREAVQMIQQAQRVDPDDLNVRVEVCRLPGFLRNDWSASVTELEKLKDLPEVQSSPLFWTCWARCNDESGRAEAAEAGYRRVLELTPADRAARLNLGLLLGRLGRGEEGTPIMQEVVNRNRDDMYAAHNLARVLEQVGRYDEAVKVLEPVVLEGDSFPVAWAQMVRLYLLVDRPADAKRVLDYAERIDANNYSVLEARAWVERYNKRYDAALKVLRRMTAQWPRNTWAARQIVEVCDESGRIGDALADLDGLIAQMPNVGELYVIRANIHGRSGDLAAALADYSLAIERYDSATYRMARGVTRWQSGDAAGAVADLEKALKIDPAEPYTALLLWHMLEDSGDSERAAEVIRQAVDKTHPQSWGGRLLRFVAGEIAEAALLKDGTGDERACEATFYVGLKHYHDGGRFEEAKPWFEKCVATDVRYFIEYRLSEWMLRKSLEASQTEP